MWIFTAREGYFSIVQKQGDDKLCVRARCANDLDRLRKSYCPHLGKTLRNLGSDYPFRAYVDREDFALGMAEAVRSIDYSNVKSETRRVLGAKREGIMHRVWSALLALEPAPKKRKGAPKLALSDAGSYEEYQEESDDWYTTGEKWR
jgi:hypothetical protein